MRADVMRGSYSPPTLEIDGAKPAYAGKPASAGEAGPKFAQTTSESLIAG